MKLAGARPGERRGRKRKEDKEQKLQGDWLEDETAASGVEPTGRDRHDRVVEGIAIDLPQKNNA